MGLNPAQPWSLDLDIALALRGADVENKMYEDSKAKADEAEKQKHPEGSEQNPIDAEKLTAVMIRH